MKFKNIFFLLVFVGLGLLSSCSNKQNAEKEVKDKVVLKERPKQKANSKKRIQKDVQKHALPQKDWKVDKSVSFKNHLVKYLGFANHQADFIVAQRKSLNEKIKGKNKAQVKTLTDNMYSKIKNKIGTKSFKLYISFVNFWNSNK